MSLLYGAPLWPAGHLPHKGGDQPSPVISPAANVGRFGEALKQPISTLVGEMSGRTQGSAKQRTPNQGAAS